MSPLFTHPFLTADEVSMIFWTLFPTSVAGTNMTAETAVAEEWSGREAEWRSLARFDQAV